MGDADCDVLVVGGGPAGAWTARLLAERGWRVLLWDRASFPRDKPCGEYLSPGAVGLLQAGLSPADIERLRPAPIKGARIVAPDGGAFTGQFRPEDGTGYSVRRLHLDAMILGKARASGVCVREAVAFRTFSREGGLMLVEGQCGGEPVQARCRVLVGADGSHSAVARRMGVVRPIRRLQKVAFVTHARNIARTGDFVEMHASRYGCVGLGPGPDGAANVTVVLTPEAARAAGRDVPGVVRRIVETYPGLRGRFEDAEWDETVLRVGTFGHGVTRAVCDGILLVGDAATFIDPFTGEGVYFALRGAELATGHIDAALRAGLATAAALAPYERDRKEAFTMKYRLCRVVERIVGVPYALGHVTARFRKDPSLADTLIRTTGDILPPSRVFSPRYLSRLLW